MHAWKEFLDTLASRGGTILILFLAMVSACLIVLHVLHHEPGNRELANWAVGLATGFGSALTLALTGGGRLANGAKPPEEPR